MIAVYWCGGYQKGGGYRVVASAKIAGYGA